MIYDCGCYDTYLSHSFFEPTNTFHTFELENMWPSWENAVAFDVSKLGLALGSLHKVNPCEVIKTYSVRGKEKKGRIREL